MTRLAPISAPKLIKLLIKLGFRLARQLGSHKFFFNPVSELTTVVPDHGSEDIGRGLLRAILNDIELSVEEFDNLRQG